MTDLTMVFSSGNFLFLMKIFALAVSGFYVFFSFVVVRQVNIMTETLEVGFENPVRIIALIHFLISIAVFLLAIIIL